MDEFRVRKLLKSPLFTFFIPNTLLLLAVFIAKNISDRFSLLLFTLWMTWNIQYAFLNFWFNKKPDDVRTNKERVLGILKDILTAFKYLLLFIIFLLVVGYIRDFFI
jgi:hypothetical protein